MKKRNTIAENLIQELFNYNPVTGVFTYRVSPNNRIKIGDVAGTLHSTGYICIKINGVQYKAHRLAWLYVYGCIPKFLDHRDRNKCNNAIENLRDTTSQGNTANRGKNKNNTSGYKGVYWNKRISKWQVSIKVNNNKQIHLGCFDSIKHAVQTYNRAAVYYFGEFAHLNTLTEV